MASKLVAFRLPQDLIEAIEAEAAATGKDKTSIVVNGLRQIFQVSADSSCPRESLQQSVPQGSEPQQSVPQRVEHGEEIAYVSVGSGAMRS
jgi:hypothetical protein